MTRRLLFIVVLVFIECSPIILCDKPKSTSQQLKDIAKLRSELTEALEAGYEEPAGVVVQPGWTKKEPSLSSAAAKVVVNEANLKSAAEWRKEIQQAVASQGQTKEVLDLEAHVKAQNEERSNAKVASVQDDMLGGSLQQITDRKDEPNLVDSSSFDMEIDLEKLQQLELSKRRTREMLILKGVEENFNVSLELGVIQYLQLRLNGSSYILGRRINDLVIYREDFSVLQIVQLPTSINAMESFDHYLLISSEKSIIWLRLEEQGGLKNYWHWPMGYEINRFRLFSVDKGIYLISSHDKSVDIFIIDLETQEFGIVQHMQMQKEITAMALLDTGRDLALAIGHIDEVLIYLHNLGNDFLNFRFSERIQAENLADVTSFQMGGRSYLALGGTRPQIIYYNQGKFHPRTILGQNFGIVEFYLPLPIRSYRDDLLLLIQHRVNFDPHFLVVIDLVIWNGEAFEASLPSPCHMMNRISYGLQCLIDDRREEGLKGSLYMSQNLLLIPRQSPAPTGVFHLQTELLPRNSEMHDIQDIYEFMQHWVKEEDDLLELSEKFLLDSTGSLNSYDEVFAPEVINDNAQIGQILVNDMTWSPQDDDKMHLLQLLEDIKKLERGITHQSKRDKRQIPIDLFRFHYEHLDFNTVEVGELFLEKLNKQNFYIQNGSIQFPHGSLTVENLELLEITKGKEMEQKESLDWANDLEFEFINGIHWEKFIDQDIIWRDQPLKLDLLEVEGPIVFEDSLHLMSLNDLSFPHDYLLSQGNTTTIIYAPKEFTETLSVNSLDTSGTINEVNPLEAITLSDDQDWPGMITFTQLEVSEKIEVKGRAQGNNEIPLNPTLKESHQIDSACHFNELIVQGPLYMKGLLDNENFDSLLGDLVQRTSDPHDEILIPSSKQIDQLDLPIDTHVDDERLSDIELENFVTKNTNQILRNLTHLQGYIYFYNLNLPKDKTYNGVQLEQLMHEAIFLDQPINASELNLNFTVNPEFYDLNVISKLNNKFLAKDYQTLSEDYHLEWAKFDHLKVTQADVNYDITGKALLNGYNGSNDIYVQELILPQGLQTEQLQGYSANLMLNFLNQELDELPLLVLHGQLKVEKILVSGDIQINSKLNNLNWAQLEREVIWLNRPNELKTRWLCQEQPIFAKNLNIEGSYNEILLPEILDDIIFRPIYQDEEILIKGPKSFTLPIKVLDNLHIEALNGVSVDHLAQTKRPLNITGDVYIEGNLYVMDVNLKGHLNHESPQELEKILVWNNTLNSFLLRGIWQSPRVSAEELTVLGHFGNQSYLPLGNFFDQLLYRDHENIQLINHQIFTGRVDIVEGAKIDEINHFPVAKLLKEMIFLDEPDQEIILNTSIYFKAPIQIDEFYAERLILPNELLNGCNVTDWLKDTIRVDRDWHSKVPLTFVAGSLNNNALRVNHLNDLDLSKVITLHQAQNLSETIDIEELYLDGEIKVEGLVNKRYLREEYENTLMNNSTYEQHVETPLILPMLHVSNSLETLAAVNGNLNLSNVATLGERELRIQSPLYLGRLHIPDLKSQRINAFNFTNWHENSLWSQGRAQQIITGNWRVNDLRIKQTPHILYRRQALKLCSQFNQMFDLLNLPYQLKNLKRSFSLKQAKNQASIRRVFALEKSKQKENYLMINELGCWTRIYKWNGTRFQHNGAFQSGPIDDVKVIESEDEQFKFMTSYELEDEEDETNWNCTGLNRLQSWRTQSEMELEPYYLPMETLEDLRTRYEEPKYQQALRYLQRPKIEINLKSRKQDEDDKMEEDFVRLHQRLLKNLNFRLQTEINITQLMIPESDLYDNFLIEDFLHLMHDLEGFHKELPTETLHLPDNPARVLAARSSQLIWNVLQELHKTQQGGDEKQNEVVLLEQTLIDVLLMVNSNNSSDHTQQLHDVIQRIRKLQNELRIDKYDDNMSTLASTTQETYQLPNVNAYWRPIQTIRMHVGSSQRPRLLYARLTLLSVDSTPPATPSTAPPANIQLHYANGSLFQSLAADHNTRQLCALRIKDETLLAFVEGCCRIRVFIYRGVQGFVLFSQFHPRGATLDSPVLQLMALRLPLQKSPGAQYVFAVIQSRKVTFYEVVIAGLLEPWLQCN